MNKFLIFIIVITIKCYSQKPFETIQKGDTLIEIRTYENLNIINEFKKIKGQDIEFFKSFELNSKILKEEGKFNKNGDWCGLRKIYSNDGKLIREVNYDNNDEKIHNNYLIPFQENFNFIQLKSENLLIEKLGKSFFENFLILNPSRTYFYGKKTSNNWFEIAEEKPIEFVMSYDLKWENKRYEIIYFKIDSLGNLIDKKAITKVHNYKGKSLISKKLAEKIALENGLTENEMPFEYKFNLEEKTKTELQMIIYGKPYETIREGNTIKESFLLLTLEPFTGKVLNVERKTYHGIID